MSREELTALIGEENRRLAGQSLTVQHGDIREDWSYEMLQVRVDPQQEADRLLTVGRDGSLLSD